MKTHGEGLRGAVAGLALLPVTQRRLLTAPPQARPHPPLGPIPGACYSAQGREREPAFGPRETRTPSQARLDGASALPPRWSPRPRICLRPLLRLPFPELRDPRGGDREERREPEGGGAGAERAGARAGSFWASPSFENSIQLSDHSQKSGADFYFRHTVKEAIGGVVRKETSAASVDSRVPTPRTATRARPRTMTR